MNTSKVTVVANAVLGKILSIIGYVLGTVSLIGVIGTLMEAEIGGAILALVALIASVFAIIIGIRIKKQIKRFKKYVALISLKQMTGIENIAANTNQSVEFVRDDLQKMIDKNFFANALIDMAANEIIIGGSTAAAPAPIQVTQQLEMETFTCPGCGASGTQPKGIHGSCDFCGSTV